MKWDAITLAVALLGVDGAVLQQRTAVEAVSGKQAKKEARQVDKDDEEEEESAAEDDEEPTPAPVALHIDNTVAAAGPMLNKPPPMIAPPPVMPPVGAGAVPPPMMPPATYPMPPMGGAQPPPPVVPVAPPMPPTTVALPTGIPAPPVLPPQPMGDLIPPPPPVMPATGAPVPAPIVPAVPVPPPPPPMAPVHIETQWEQYADQVASELHGVEMALDDHDLTGPEFAHELSELAADTTPEMAKMMHHVLEKEKVIKDVLVDPILINRRGRLRKEFKHAQEMIERERDHMDTEPVPATVVPMLPIPEAAVEPSLTEGKAPMEKDNKPNAAVVLIGATIAFVVFGVAFYVMKR